MEGRGDQDDEAADKKRKRERERKREKWEKIGEWRQLFPVLLLGPLSLLGFHHHLVVFSFLFSALSSLSSFECHVAPGFGEWQ